MDSPDEKNRPSVIICDDDAVLIALLAPMGFRAEWVPMIGYLKVASGRAFAVERSEIEYFDSEGRSLEVKSRAFGMQIANEITGPYCARSADDRRRPDKAASAVWRLADLEVWTDFSGRLGEQLRVTYLPLQVDVSDDRHIVVQYVNTTADVLDRSAGIRGAVCRIDGRAYLSQVGGHWDGDYEIRPRHAALCEFKLSDFGAARCTGVHTMSVELFGSVSEPVEVSWKSDA